MALAAQIYVAARAGLEFGWLRVMRHVLVVAIAASVTLVVLRASEVPGAASIAFAVAVIGYVAVALVRPTTEQRELLRGVLAR